MYYKVTSNNSHLIVLIATGITDPSVSVSSPLWTTPNAPKFI